MANIDKSYLDLDGLETYDGKIKGYIENAVNTPYPDYVNNIDNGINVKDYGATGDGTTDDSQAFIDACAAAVSANKNIILIPDGIYNLNHTSIVLSALFTFIGKYSKKCIIVNSNIAAPRGIICKNLVFEGGTTRHITEAGISSYLQDKIITLFVTPKYDDTEVSYYDCIFRNAEIASFAFTGESASNEHNIASQTVHNCLIENLSLCGIAHSCNITHVDIRNNTFKNIGNTTSLNGWLIALQLGDTSNNTTHEVTDGIIDNNIFDTIATGTDISSTAHSLSNAFICIQCQQLTITHNKLSNMIGYGADREAIYTKGNYIEIAFNEIYQGGSGEAYICCKFKHSGNLSNRLMNIHDNILTGEYGNGIRAYGNSDIHDNYINIKKLGQAIRVLSGSNELSNESTDIYNNYIYSGVGSLTIDGTTVTKFDPSEVIQVDIDRAGDINVNNNFMAIIQEDGFTKSFYSAIKIQKITSNIEIKGNTILLNDTNNLNVAISLSSLETAPLTNTNITIDIEDNFSLWQKNTAILAQMHSNNSYLKPTYIIKNNIWKEVSTGNYAVNTSGPALSAIIYYESTQERTAFNSRHLYSGSAKYIYTTLASNYFTLASGIQIISTDFRKYIVEANPATTTGTLTGLTINGTSYAVSGGGGTSPLIGNTTTVTPSQVAAAIAAGRPVAITYTDATLGDIVFNYFVSNDNNGISSSSITCIHYSETSSVQYGTVISGEFTNDTWEFHGPFALTTSENLYPNNNTLSSNRLLSSVNFYGNNYNINAPFLKGGIQLTPTQADPVDLNTLQEVGTYFCTTDEDVRDYVLHTPDTKPYGARKFTLVVQTIGAHQGTTPEVVKQIFYYGSYGISKTYERVGQYGDTTSWTDWKEIAYANNSWCLAEGHSLQPTSANHIDLNNIVEAGTYYTSTETLAGYIDNKPSDSTTRFTLIVQDIGNTTSANIRVKQLFMDANTFNIYVRYRNGSDDTWHGWKKLAYSDEIPTKLSDLTDDVVSGNYVKLDYTGASQTISNDGTATPLKLKGSTSKTFIEFIRNGTLSFGSIGVNSSGVPIFSPDNGTTDYRIFRDGDGKIWQLAGGIPITATSEAHADLNAFTASGTYYISSNTANYVDNKPVSADNTARFTLIVQRIGNAASYIRQIYMRYSDNNFYVRSSKDAGSTWTDWVRLAYSNEIPTESTVSGWGFTKNTGTVTQVKVGTTAYDPTSGVVSLPAYPTTLPASDVYAWAKASTKPSYTASEVGALASTTKYAGASTAGGAATSAAKLTNTAKIGNTNQPVYFTADGVPAAISYTIDKSVPSNAVFTDTTYSSKTAASGGTDVSLVTTGEKYTWNNKSNLTIGTTATTAAAGNHTHATSIAASSATNQITLAASTRYAITAGGTSYVFTTPPNTTYESKAAASGGTAVSLVTTGEKYTWNNKSNLTIGTTATTAAAGNHTHTTSIAASSGTNQLTLAFGTKYAITAGGTSYVFTMPANPNTNTTYSFANGTNGFTVTPSGGTAQTVTVTPSIANNITGSGTSGYIAKFNGTNTITNGPAFGTATTTFLRNDGTWATPTASWSGGTITSAGKAYSKSGSTVGWYAGYGSTDYIALCAGQSGGSTGLLDVVANAFILSKSNSLTGLGNWRYAGRLATSRFQCGTASTTRGTAKTVSFSPAFAGAPIVVIVGDNVSYFPAVTSVTASGFTFSTSGTASTSPTVTIRWMAYYDA